MTRPSSLRGLPSVDKILQAFVDFPVPRPIITQTVRAVLKEFRQSNSVPAHNAVIKEVEHRLNQLRLRPIQRVLNGTGILAHTNLGRTPLASKAIEAITSVASGYSNLEYDVEQGARGGRALYLEDSLALLCGAEAATVVNNCAAALVLLLRQFATGSRTEVLISRSELIQIGGGFRIPDILAATGAKLREVGTTNKTTLQDYAQGITPNTGLILKVHQSNFFMEGFVESVPTEALAKLAHEHSLPCIEDLGSGAVISTNCHAQIEHEPTPEEVLRRGVDLVCFSGDKLFGGPQAGIIAGKREYIALLKKAPFYRALRCDKLILAALQATVDIYLEATGGERERALDQLPLVSMLRQTYEQLLLRAQRLAQSHASLPAQIYAGQGKSQIGGGTLPRSTLLSATLDIVPHAISVDELAQRLRLNVPPVIGYIAGGVYKLDLRTIFPEQESELSDALHHALAPRPEPAAS